MRKAAFEGAFWGRMKMTKKVSFGFMLTILLFCLCACGSKHFTCDLCQEKKNERPHTISVLGQEYTVCEKCYKQYNEEKASLFGF